MSWRLAVEHTTEQRYGGVVLASYNEARITPPSSEAQLVMDHEIGIRPVTRMLRYVDYWGTKVTAFDVHEPHERLVVHGRSLVETGLRPGVAAPVSWEVLTGASCHDEFHEFLGPSPYVPPDDAVLGDRARDHCRARTNSGGRGRRRLDARAPGVRARVDDRAHDRGRSTRPRPRCLPGLRARRARIAARARDSRRATCPAICIRRRTPRWASG